MAQPGGARVLELLVESVHVQAQQLVRARVLQEALLQGGGG
jgi:hypothetical protein